MKPEKIIKMLKSSNKAKAQEGLRLLLEVAKSSPAEFQSFIPNLKAGLGDSKPDIRERFIVTVGIIGKDTPALIKPLVLPLALNLQDQHEEVRYKAAYSLYIIALKDTRAVKDAIPVMMKVLEYAIGQGAYPVFRNYKPYTLVLKTLNVVSETTPGYLRKGVNIIAKCIDYPLYRPENPHSGMLEFYPEAVSIIGNVGKRYPEDVRQYIPFLLRCYVDSFRYAGTGGRKEGMEALRQVCVGAFKTMSKRMMNEIVEALVAYVANLNNYGRKNVESLLLELSQKHLKLYIRALIRLFDAEDKDIREKAVGVLEKVGKKRPNEVLEEIYHHIQKGSEKTRTNAMIAAGMVARHTDAVDKKILKALISSVSAPSPQVRLTAVSTLGSVIEAHPKYIPSASPHLIKAMGDDYHHVRWSAIYAVAKIGEVHGIKSVATMIPKLLECLNDPYDQVRWKAIDTLKKLNIDRYQFPNTLNEIRGTEKLISDMGAEGVDPGVLKKAQGDLKGAYEALYNGDYQKAIAINSAIKEDLLKLRTTGLDTKRINAGKILKDLRMAIESARNEGYDTTRVEGYLEKAREAMKARDYGTVREYYSKVQDTLSEIIATEKVSKKPSILKPPTKDGKPPVKSDFSDIINWIEEQVITAKQNGVDCSKAESMLEQAKKAISMGYSTAAIMGYITDAKVALKDAKSVSRTDADLEATAHETLASALAVISTAKAQDTDVSAAEALLKEAELGIKQKDFTKVIKYASKAEEKAKKYLKIAMLQRSSEDLIKISEWVNDAKDFGLDVSEASKLLRMAKEAFKEEDFEGVERYIRMIKETLDMQKKAFVRKQAEDLYNSILSDIKVARAEGIDLTDINDMVTTAKECMENEDYDRLYDITLKVEDLLSNRRMEALKTEAESSISSVKEQVWHLEQLGLVNEDLKNAVNRAERFFKEGHYKQAKSYATELLAEIEGIIETGYKSALRRKILTARSNLEALEADGYDTIDIMNTVQEAMELFDNKKYMECEKRLVEVDNRIMELKHQKEMEEATAHYLQKKAHSLIEEAVATGCKEGEFKKQIEKAQKLFEDRKYEEAILCAKKAMKIAKRPS